MELLELRLLLMFVLDHLDFSRDMELIEIDCRLAAATAI